MRGKVTVTLLYACFVGITPACAGKSICEDRADRIFGDHPRMCGEKWEWASDGGKMWGSPPHVRGKDIPELADVATIGITPACAGKSPVCIIKHILGEDHPRMCGEK